MKEKNKCMCQPWTYILLVNTLILYLASIFYPSLVVLGNDNIYPLASLIFASLILTIALSQIQTITAFLNLKIKKDSTWSLVYTAANILLLWSVARGAYYTGFGLASFLVAIMLGTILSIVQYQIWKIVSGGKKEK